MDIIGTTKEKFKLEIWDREEESEHFHQDIELLFVLDGKLDVTVGDEVIHMGSEDLLVVNANKHHRLHASKDILYAKFTIQWQLVSEASQSMSILYWCNSVLEDSERYGELKDAMKRLLNHHLSIHEERIDFGYMALCYQVLEILSLYFQVSVADRGKQTEQEKIDERMELINNYILANYDQPISLNDLSEKLFLSTSHLSRFFKKHYGMNFVAYLENIRMHYAMEELLYSNKPITRIVYDNGFSSVAAFNKVFKKQNGETPSEMRKKYRDNDRKENQIQAGSVVEKRLEAFLRDDGIKRERKDSHVVEVAVTVAAPFAKTKFAWGNTINIGSAADLLKSELQEHIVLLQGAFHFKYVRFWNIFSADMLLNEKKEGDVFNFSRLDAILEYLAGQGLKPHFELGLKPKRIHKTIQKYILKDSEGAGIQSIEQMGRTLDAMMNHLIHRYSRQDMDGWRFEIWFDEWEWNQKNGMDEYIRAFAEMYGILKSYSKGIEVGGCGLRLNRDGKSTRFFLDKWNASSCRPDFLSGYFYSYDRGKDDKDEFVKRSTNNDYMMHSVASVKKIIFEAGFGDVPFYLTEWNLSISDRNVLNDTCFKGAYIVKNMLNIYGMADVAAYFFGSDRAAEYYDSSSLLYGGNGMMSKDGILKPAGFAMDFLNRLYPYYVDKGKNYLVTTNGEDSYGIICHNQKPLGYSYYLVQEDQVEREHIWKYFKERDLLELKIHLGGLENGIYKIKYYRLSENSGSVFDLWKEMGFEEELSRNDIKYFQRVCEPKLIVCKEKAKAHQLNIQITLTANEFVFIRMRRLV